MELRWRTGDLPLTFRGTHEEGVSLDRGILCEGVTELGFQFLFETWIGKAPRCFSFFFRCFAGRRSLQL